MGARSDLNGAHLMGWLTRNAPERPATGQIR